MTPEEIETIGVSLSRGGESLLLLQVSRDGRAKRLGDGTPGGPRDYVNSTAPPELFLAVRDGLSAELLQRSGRYELPGASGDLMELTIRLVGEDEHQVLELSYGADSATPPEDVQRFVSMAVAVTDEWYEELQGAEG